MFTLNCKGKLLTARVPVVMGIINTTPDSFYSGSRQAGIDEALATAGQMISEGATILDIGGQSTRPGAIQADAAEEISRVTPVISAIHARFPDTFISVDTYRANVAEAAIAAGASIVNDIGGGFFDPEMLPAVGRLHVPYVLMHVKGNAVTMHKNPAYEQVTREVLDYFIRRIDDCRKNGIDDVIIDPGFGFSKNNEHNFQLLNELEAFKILPNPVLLGISRKSTIYKTLGTTADNALNGTSVLNTIGLMKGASILRVHDVKEAMEAITLVNSVTGTG